MKFKINATEYAAITDDATKALYKQVGDDYVIQIEGMPDFAGMERKNAELLDEMKQSKAKTAERERAEKTARDELARKNGDVEALENSYKQQIAEITAGFDAERGRLNGSLSKLLVRNVARDLANELGGNADNAALWMPHILPRLSVELVGEDHVTRVLDANGKPSALDVAGLGKELGGNKMFAAILKGPGSQGTPKPGDQPSQPNPNSRQSVDPMYNAALAAIKGMGDNGTPSV